MNSLQDMIDAFHEDYDSPCLPLRDQQALIQNAIESEGFFVHWCEDVGGYALALE